MELKDRRAQDAIKALLSLEEAGYMARLAGGCVRDRLMGVPPTDYDVATNATPEQTTSVFRAQGQKVIPTGIDHGTVTVVAPAGPIEVTTLRRDVTTDGRRAQVAFGQSFDADAERRDFTINAMFEDARGEIFDVCGGKIDLAAKRLRFVGEATTRIREDYLRIMRLFRFWAKLGFTPVPDTLEAIAAEKAGLLSISQERTTSELLKTLGGAAAGPAVHAMHATGVWDLVMPELNRAAPGPRAPLPEAFWTMLAPVPPARRGLAALAATCLWEWTVRDPGAWQGLAERLRLARAQARALAWFPALTQRLAHPGSETADLLLLAEECDHHAGPDSLETLLGPTLAALGELGAPAVQPLVPQLRLLCRTDAVHGHRRRNTLPVSGKDVMAHLGLMPGPELGQALEEMRRSYLNGAWTSRAEGLACLQKNTQDH